MTILVKEQSQCGDRRSSSHQIPAQMQLESWKISVEKVKKFSSHPRQQLHENSLSDSSKVRRPGELDDAVTQSVRSAIKVLSGRNEWRRDGLNEAN